MQSLPTYTLLGLLLAVPSLASAQEQKEASFPTVVPLPAEYDQVKSGFVITPESVIVASTPEEVRVARLLAAWLRPYTGFELPIKASAATGNPIRVIIEPELDKKLGREGYEICHGEKGWTIIRAAHGAGLFYGVQTFRQLLPVAERAQKNADGNVVTEPFQIVDQPRFAWRGFMIDVSRHFIKLEDLKVLVDDMAALKLNILQLHLTDDDGWRIEIKKYPKLTEIGAWRGTDCQLPNTRPGENHARYGGFYTQEQLKDLVAYAKERNIDIVPEIDLPGHALAIAKAYPETLPAVLSDAVSTQGFKANAISPANEKNYEMIDDIIGEVAEIFPYAYIHIGGDEVNHKIWEACPQIKELMVKEKLANLHQVQVYFTKRLETILAKHDRKMIGWQEIADNNLNKETAIMAWIGSEPGWNAAKRGTPAVLGTGGHCYFDMPYPGAEDEPPSHWWAGPVGLKNAYEFDPLPARAGLDKAAEKNILGIQGALWTEYVVGWKSKSGWLELKDENECAQFKTWPRLHATAEVCWTPQHLREYSQFRLRMADQYEHMALAGRKFYLEPATAEQSHGKIKILPPYPGAEVRYTLDGSDPFGNSKAQVWDGKPLDSSVRGRLAMRTVMPKYNIFSTLRRGATIPPVGTWEVSQWAAGEAKTLSFPVSDHISEAGRWKVSLPKTKGSAELAADSAELRQDGKVLASAMANRNNFVFDLSTFTPDKGALELVVTARYTHEKRDAIGNVLVEMLAAPVVLGITVETKIASNGKDFDAAQLLDGDPATYFWSSRMVEKDETLTWVLPEATALKSVSLQSGQPNSTKDQILDAVLEVSEDGKTFTKVSGFAYGAAKAELNGKKIKAIRVLATGKSASWIIFQDLVITK